MLLQGDKKQSESSSAIFLGLNKNWLPGTKCYDTTLYKLTVVGGVGIRVCGYWFFLKGYGGAQEGHHSGHPTNQPNISPLKKVEDLNQTCLSQH